jgi:hypothetical protein
MIPDLPGKYVCANVDHPGRGAMLPLCVIHFDDISTSIIMDDY